MKKSTSKRKCIVCDITRPFSHFGIANSPGAACDSCASVICSSGGLHLSLEEVKKVVEEEEKEQQS